MAQPKAVSAKPLFKAMKRKPGSARRDPLDFDPTPQRNSWFAWDKNRPALGPNEWRRKRLYKESDGAEQREGSQ